MQWRRGFLVPLNTVSRIPNESGPGRIIAALNLDGMGPKWTTSCPAHEDSSPSLSVRLADNGNLLLNCHAGCKTGEILTAIGVHASDLFERSTSGQAEGPIATYNYVDENGTLLYQVLRYAGHRFKQRRPAEGGGWEWGTAGVKRVLYNLPSVIEAVAEERRIFVVEGEKDADMLTVLGCTATTNCCGAGRWRDEHSLPLHGATVAIIPDNDEAGDDHALAVAEALTNKAAEVKIVRLPGLGNHEDVSDWIERGGNREALETLVASSAIFAAPSQLELRPDKKFQFLTLEQLSQLPPVPWLVEGVLPAEAFAIVYAPPASFKSFLCIDLALSVAAGKPWHGHSTTQGPVVYVAAEGNPSELYKRAKAWLEHYGLTTSDFYCAPSRLDLGDATSVEAFLREVPVTPRLIVVVVLQVWTRTAPRTWDAQSHRSTDFEARLSALYSLSITRGSTMRKCAGIVPWREPPTRRSHCTE
jgi:putative DNA primase/helicase